MLPRLPSASCMQLASRMPVLAQQVTVRRLAPTGQAQVMEMGEDDILRGMPLSMHPKHHSIGSLLKKLQPPSSSKLADVTLQVRSGLWPLLALLRLGQRM